RDGGGVGGGGGGGGVRVGGSGCPPVSPGCAIRGPCPPRPGGRRTAAVVRRPPRARQGSGRPAGRLCGTGPGRAALPPVPRRRRAAPWQPGAARGPARAGRAGPVLRPAAPRPTPGLVSRRRPVRPAQPVRG